MKRLIRSTFQYPAHLTASPTANSQTALRCIFLVVFCAINLAGCNNSEHLAKSQIISENSVSTASISDNAIIIGTLDQGALAHLSSLTTANYRWRNSAANQAPISAVAYSQKKGLAITSSGSTLNIWDAQTGKSKHFLSAPSTINALAINPTGSLAVLGLDNHSAIVLNLDIGGIVKTWPHESPVLAVAINNEGLVLTGEEANQAHLWHITKSESLHSTPHNDAVTFVNFSPNGKIATSSSRYDAIKFWRTTDTFQLIDSISGKAMALKAGRRAIDLQFITEDKILAAFSDNTVELRQIKHEKPLKKWSIGQKTFLAKNSSTPIALGEFKQQWYVLTTDGQIYTLGTF